VLRQRIGYLEMQGKKTMLRQIKRFIVACGNRSSNQDISDAIDLPDSGAALIAAATSIVMAIGFAIALGLRPELGMMAASIACIGYAGILFSRRSAPQAGEVNDFRSGGINDRGEEEMHITLHTPDTIYAPRHIPSWLALACAAGSVNGFAFLSCEEFVSHITGTSTRIGLEWEWHHFSLAGEYTLVLASFVVGAIASVIWLQARACRGKRPRWATPLRAVALILASAAIAGHGGYFGPFGGQTSGEPPFILLSVLAFAMGLQNAAVASTTGLAVRTTHLTGPATDLGIHLGTAFFGTRSERREAFKGAGLRAGKILAFIVGAGLALPLSNRFGYLCLLAPASLVSFAAALSFLPDWGPSDFPFRRRRADDSLKGSKPVEAAELQRR
jgi:uncharacterized membrane protein YoaK (UPF0700 family)